MHHLSTLALALAAQPLSTQKVNRHPNADGCSERFASGRDKDHWNMSDGWTNYHRQDWQGSSRKVQVRGNLMTMFHIPVPGNGDRPDLHGQIHSRAYLQNGTYEANIRTPNQSVLIASTFTYAELVQDSPYNNIYIKFLTCNPCVIR